MASGPPQPAPALAVGDERRLLIRRAVLGALLAGSVFSLLAGPVKQVPALYDHAPWLEDPFDAVVSFAMFFVPLVTACCALRLPLCRRSEPLPVARAADLLRGCRILLAMMAVTLLAQWVAIAIGANRAHWNWATWLQAGGLAAMTLLTVRSALRLRGTAGLGANAAADSIRGATDSAAAPDWLGDMLTLAERHGRWPGQPPVPTPANTGQVTGAPGRAERLLIVVRAHPLWTAALVAAAFGIAVGGAQSLSEGYVAVAALLVVTLLGCGMFAFLVGAGSYLGLVRSTAPLAGASRRAVDAVVLTCVGVLVALAFRHWLWWLTGVSAATAGSGQLVVLLGLTAITVFTVTLGAETAVHAHPRTASQIRTARSRTRPPGR